MTTENRSEVVERISRIRNAYERAEKEGRFEPVAPYVADDLVVMPPGNQPIEGKSAWREIFNEAMADAPDQDYGITYSSAETVVSGDFAFDRGTATDTKLGDEDERIQRDYSYLWLYRRASDESWKLTHVIWNDNG